MKTAVIGAGIGGLSVAIRLAAAGHDITVLEKNATPGGKISEIRLGEYRFDTGPSLFTLPELAEELFRLCGEEMKDHLPLARLDVNCRYFYPDKTVFTFYHDPEKLMSELTVKGIGEEEALRQRLSKSKKVYELSAPVFLFSNFHKLSNFNTPPYRNIATKLHKLDFMRTMHQANAYDFKDKRLVSIFDRYATYNGSSPYRAPATLNMIAHLENNIGAFFPTKGMYAIIEELYGLAIRQGVKFRFEEPVEKIVVRDKKAIGLVVDGKTEYYDTIISDVDVRYLSEHLIEKHPLRKRLSRVEASSSALIFYWCMKREFAQLDLHNIIFSENYRKEFRYLFGEKAISDDPTVYIFISSKVVPGDAPHGCENWFVMVNAPSDNGQDWNQLIARTRRNIVSKINNVLKEDIEKYITAERIATPLSIEVQTMSTGGALYGASSNSKFSAFLRHPNVLTSIRNLYFVGGSVHPGGGIPLCMASAKIVSDEIQQSEK